MQVPRIRARTTGLLVIDVQERLLPVIEDGERVVANTIVAIRAARMLDLPIFLTEQYPRGLGRTVSAIVEALGDAYRPYEKVAFSACGAAHFADALRDRSVRRLLIAGIEAHVCVLQTALDLLEDGYAVFPIADAISSRTAENRELGLQRMQTSGAILVSTEMLLFELLRTADDPRFKELQRLIK